MSDVHFSRMTSFVGLLIDFHIVFILTLETYDHVIVATVSESQYFRMWYIMLTCYPVAIKTKLSYTKLFYRALMANLNILTRRHDYLKIIKKSIIVVLRGVFTVLLAILLLERWFVSELSSCCSSIALYIPSHMDAR